MAQKRKDILVSIIIPAYKQEKTILADIKRIDEVMFQTRWNYELIIVVDGFVDKTYQEAKKAAGENIKVFGYKTNRGKGYAVRYGMARAMGDFISFIDSGMEIDPNGISMILEHMIWYDADIIVGSKRHPASKVSFPPLRRFYSWGYHTLVRILFRLKVKDTQAGLKVFKREVLEKVLPRLLIRQYAFDVEVLAVAKHLGYKRIFEAPIQITFDFESGSRFVKFMFLDPFIRLMFLDTAAIFYRMYFLKYYDDKSKRKWIYDKELDMRVNTGEMGGES